jgi:acyl-CoA dehydrogenase
MTEVQAMLGFDLTDEQNDLKALARRFTEHEIIPRARQYDVEATFPRDVCEKAFAAGLMNFAVPKELGGPGMGTLDVCLITEELNYGCSGIANAIAANDLGVMPLLIAGSEEQKRAYLRRLMQRLTFCAFAITEPGAGSDVAAMAAGYRRDGDGFVLNGVKHFISNGSVADWYTMFATSDRRLRHKGISCFVLPADLPGITKTRMHGKLGQRAADTGEIVFDNVRVPAEALVGSEGQGFEYAMKTFERSRPQIGAIATGVARRALDECVKYAKQRSAFGQPIASFQALQFMMADMAVEIEAMRLLTCKAAWSVDQGNPRNVISSFAKVFSADACMKITTDAVQIFGGYGYMNEYPVEKLMRDAKLLQIYEGTQQIQRVVIARELLKE